MSQPTSVFVYGTLKQGSLRSTLWPFQPQQIAVAEITGKLFDLGPYPAACDGNDRIRGERWDFLPSQMAKTIELLDRIEGYRQDAEDLYERRILACRDAQGVSTPSFVYFFADHAWAAKHERVMPNAEGVCVWHAPPGLPPVTNVDE